MIFQRATLRFGRILEMVVGEGYFVSLSLYKKPPRAAPAFHSLGSRTPFCSAKFGGSHRSLIHFQNHPPLRFGRILEMVVGEGFEPPNPEGADLQSAVVGHLTIPPQGRFTEIYLLTEQSAILSKTKLFYRAK